ncbi:MAG: T9SS type A sorting domain-containing protein [Flavobacteriales bacterium]
MKKLLLLFFSTLMLVNLADAQSNNPILTGSIHPNPVEDKAILQFDEPVYEPITVTIKDLTGKLLYKFNPDTQGEACTAINLDMLTSLRRGIYILQVSSQSGKIKTMKFQKT